MQPPLVLQRYFIVAGFLVVLGYTAWQVVSVACALSAASVLRPPPQLVYASGDTLPSIDTLGLTSADRTLLMFLRSTCAYCTESMPFYRRLAENREDVQLVALCIEHLDTCREYVARHQLSVDAVVPQPADLRIPGTPTLILVDRHARLQAAWIGRQDATREYEILGVLKRRK